MNGGRGGNSGEGEIVIVVFLGWVDRGGGVLVVGWLVVLWSEAFVDQG